MRRLEESGAPLFPLGSLCVRLRYRVKTQRRTLTLEVDAQGLRTRENAENADVALSVTTTQECDGLVVRSHIRALRSGVVLDRLEPLVLVDRADREDLTFFRNGWQSWSGSSSFGRTDVEPLERRLLHLREVGRNPCGPRPGGRGVFTADLCMAAVSPSAGQALVLGYLGGASQFGGFQIDARPGRVPRIVAWLPFGGVPMSPGETRDGEPLLVLRGNDPLALLEQYASHLGCMMNARVPAESTSGWCSWYRYFTNIDETSMTDNLFALKARRSSLPVTLFQVDDGYQSAIGDWRTTNAKFPQGMKALAKEIGRQGLTPGLWLAPFIAGHRSGLLAEHPDWFIQTALGRPRRALFNPVWSRWHTAKALDPTHPGVQRWLAELFQTVAHDWGYRFLKLDFLFAASLPGRRYDSRRTGAEALRRGLEIIRESVGDDVHLLGCGCPLGSAVGLVDSMRIGPDVSPHWTNWIAGFMTDDYGVIPSTRAALRNVMSRSFMHRHLWQNDPDCILVGDRGAKLDVHEVRSLASLAALSGGTVLLSDDLTTLPSERADIARTALAIQAEVQGGTPICLDLMTSRFPGLCWMPRQQGGGYLAVFNSDDEVRDIEVDIATHAPLKALGNRLRAREVWSGLEAMVTGPTMALTAVPRHGVRLFLIERG